MKPWTRPALAGLIAGLAATPAAHAASTVIDLETFENISLGAEDFYKGADGAGEFVSNGASFRNSYDSEFDSWSGFAASSTTDTTTPGFNNQYSAFAGGGAGGSSNYAVGNTGFGGSTVAFGSTVDLTGVGSAAITNTTYAALSMRDGDGFAKQFGGPSGDDPDFFLLTIEGLLNESSTGTIDFYLADYRFADNSQDYILDEWTTVDLSSLGQVDELFFTLSSSDNGEFGMNTPAYFAMDNLTVPEPSTAALLALAGAGFLRRRR